MKKLIVLLLTAMLLLSLSACSDNGEADANEVPTEAPTAVAPATEEGTEEEPSEEEPATDTLTLGSTFEFDDLEITIHDQFGWTTLENQFSDLDGSDVFYLPITVTNLHDETHGLNMFTYRFFGSNGLQLDNVSAFFDNDIAWAGDMRSGATLESYIYFLYDGDGEYVVEFFQLFGATTEVVFQVQR